MGENIIEKIQKRRFSSIDVINPDMELYPNYYKAKRFEILLSEGTYLFIPYGWYHHIFSEKVNEKTKLNVAINFWTRNNVYNEIIISNKCYKNITDVITLSNEKIIYEEFSQKSQPFKYYKKINNSIDNLKDILKRISLSYTFSSNSVFTSDYIDSNIRFDDCTLDEYINSNFKYKYIFQNDITSLKNTEYIKNIKPSWLSEYTDKIKYNLWINQGNISSKNHYDLYDNIILQINGTKKVYLFPPNERDNLYLMNNINIMNILNTKEEYYLGNKNIIEKQVPYVQLFNNNITPSDYDNINNYLKVTNYKEGYIYNKEIDNSLYIILSDTFKKYIDLLINLNNEMPLNLECEDSGYYLSSVYSILKPLYNNESKFRYIWFLSDFKFYINKVEIDAKIGSLLLYPAHFTYVEKPLEEVTINKWICSGYIKY